jgi:hypothetical protein
LSLEIEVYGGLISTNFLQLVTHDNNDISIK